MNPFDMLKNVQSLKDSLGQAQAELETIQETGSSGGNIVRVTLNGKMEIINIELDPICVDPRDVKMLQDLIIAAHHDAMDKIQLKIKDKYGSMLSGMGIPGL
jgi:DNA-binding YbaB/EbfC family protein